MKTQDPVRLLRANPYPGRGILLGRSPDGRSAVAAYFLMGRSAHSRNRILAPTEDGIRTQARDPSKVADPSLILYRPVRQLENWTIVTNGDQTDTLYGALRMGGSFQDALMRRTFEPDAPHYTPRISGLITRRDGEMDLELSILKSSGGNPASCVRCFYRYDPPLPGEGRLLHTYAGDGDPLPSFEGEPVRVSLEDAAPGQLAERLWEALDAENRISLFVRYIDLATGAWADALKNR